MREEDEKRPLAKGVSGCLLDTLISIFLCIMQWDEKELDAKFTPNAEMATFKNQKQYSEREKTVF